MNFIKNAFTASAVLLTVAISAPASADTFNLFTNGGDGFVTGIVPNGFHLFGQMLAPASIRSTPRPL